MTGMKQFHGRYSPGCGGRISPRTLAADLEGELLEQVAFEVCPDAEFLVNSGFGQAASPF